MGDQLADGVLLIDGDRVAEGSEPAHQHVNPATGCVQASVAVAGCDEVDRAARAADRAFKDWRERTGAQRRDVLFALSDLVSRHADELKLLASLEAGAPASQTGWVDLANEWIRYYAGWADKLTGSTAPTAVVPGFDFVEREPFGVVGVIVPWNSALLLAVMSAVPALAAGNCVVLKPSELAPFTCLRFGELAEEAGLPSGVLQVLPGGAEAGDALVRHPLVRKVAFTGGPDTARQILAAAATTMTPVSLELGGKSASIVLPDADLDVVGAFSAQMGLVVGSGQACAIPTRLLVHEAVHDVVLEQLLAAASTFKVGMPLHPDTAMGPLITDAAVKRVLGVVDRATAGGAGELVLGGNRVGGELAAGFFVEPTVFDRVDPASELSQREIFGPVLAVSTFATIDQAVAIANGTDYGLAAYVHTSDLRAAHALARRLEAGYVSVNGFAGLTPAAPFGGLKASGFGREGGLEGLHEFTQTKNVFIAH